ADLIELGVEVRNGVRVTNVGDGWVEAGGERIEARTGFWAAGNAASPLGKSLLGSLGAPLDRAGRVQVAEEPGVPGLPNVFVVGALAVLHSKGRAVPAIAPAAIQSGKAAARNVLHTIRREGRERFRYINKGDLATIGRYRAVGVVAGKHLKGWL